MKELAAAMVRAQKAFGPALKTATNPHFKSKYADLSACVEAVIDALNSNGIALMQRTLADDTGVTVTTVFVHESGEMMDSGPLHVPAAKSDPQGYGSALTYARRYSLMAACGIAPEDDDGNAASKAARAAHERISKIAEAARQKFAAGNEWGAYEETAHLDNDDKLALWAMLKGDSALRAAIKRCSEEERKRQDEINAAKAVTA